MKRLFYLLLLTVFSFVSCSQQEHDSLTEERGEKLTLNLDSFTYNEVAAVFQNGLSEQQISICEGGVVRDVVLSPDSTEVQGEDAILFVGREKDSLSMVFSRDYVSLSMSVNGEKINYVDYKDSDKMNEVIAQYEEQLPSVVTKAGQNILTRAGSDGGLKLNITRAASLLPQPDYNLNENDARVVEKVLPSDTIPLTKASAPKIVCIFLLKEKGSNTMSHEITWQISDAVASVRRIAPDVQLKFVVDYCDFKGSRDSSSDLDKFTDWKVANPKYKDNQKDVFFLIRWGAWKNLVSGCAWMDTYSLKNKQNLNAVGVSATSCLYALTLAHELGHIFGADHTKRMYFSTDLMSYSLFKTNKHYDKKNIIAIKSNLSW